MGFRALCMPRTWRYLLDMTKLSYPKERSYGGVTVLLKDVLDAGGQ